MFFDLDLDALFVLSKTKKVVSLSTTKAEYYGVVHVVLEVIWI